MEFKFSEGPAKKVAVFEIMDALEKYAETHYAQIKEALKEKRQVRCMPLHSAVILVVIWSSRGCAAVAANRAGAARHSQGEARKEQVPQSGRRAQVKVWWQKGGRPVASVDAVCIRMQRVSLGHCALRNVTNFCQW
jgi:hypothetical protein